MKQSTLIRNCYDLLQGVLADAFKLQTHLFTPPYENLNKIDQGIRAAVWTNYQDDSTAASLGGRSDRHRLLIIKSNLNFYNILVLFAADTSPIFFSLGPFRDEDLSPNYFTQILKDANIAPADIRDMKYVYERMPFVQVDTVLNVTKHILGSFFPEFKEITPEIMQFAEHNRTIHINRDLLDNYSIEYAEQYRELLLVFLKHLSSGDSDVLKKDLQRLLDTIRMPSQQGMRDYKAILQSINDFCHMTLLHTSVHPLYTIRLFESLRLKIENTASLAKLEQLPHEICRKYSLLVKNYANMTGSRLTKDVIAYVQLHLDEDLSLHRLAEHFNRNASVLSNTFSKETGQTLTKFIHHTRVQEAIRLFNTTSLSVSEVALSVGYPDFSYFSKIFSRHVGCSPREYQKQTLS